MNILYIIELGGSMMNYQEYLETWVELYIRGEINSRKVPLTEKEYNEKYAE